LADEEHDSHKVSIVQLTQTAVKKAIIELDEQKGPGPDGISPSILRKLISVVKDPLVNLSLSTGIFPAVWKESFVVPILKNHHQSSGHRFLSCSMVS
jgi:hypothetical protein